MDNRSITTSIAGLLVLFCFPAWADFFVSPTGSDANPGSKAKPFATLERARDAARTRKVSQSAFRETITLWLRGGDYLRTNALELTAADSGTPNHPTVWRAYGDERVRLLGGHGLTGFQPVTDAGVEARFPADPVRSDRPASRRRPPAPRTLQISKNAASTPRQYE